jgi:hypothetical protein
MTPSPVNDIHVSASVLISVGQSLLVWNTVNGSCLLLIIQDNALQLKVKRDRRKWLP